jgi:hypothetical protein
MSDLKGKGWRELCEAASHEHNPQRLLELIQAINETRDQREQEQKRSRDRTLRLLEFSSPYDGTMVT